MGTYAGKVERIVFSNPVTGYTVFSLKAPQRRRTLTVVCTLPFRLHEKQEVEVTGEAIYHAKFGDQIKATEVRLDDPTTEDGIRDYLATGAIPGIGPATADRIVELFGDQTFAVFDSNPEQLLEVSGIGHKKLAAIVEAWKDQREGVQTLTELCRIGLSPVYAAKVLRQYGAASALPVVRENPFRLAEEIHGIGFKKADEIAAKMGLQADHPFRMRAGVIYTLKEALAAGHCYLPKDRLLQQSSALLTVDQAAVSVVIGSLIRQNHLVTRRRRDSGAEDPEPLCYLSSVYEAERSIEKRLRDMSTLPPGQLQGCVDSSLTEEQSAAVTTALSSGLTVITGSAGTGKTTTLRALLGLLEAQGVSYRLCAPTGKAAKRITEVTGREASTIHRLIGIKGATFSVYSPNNPLPVDYVICDESSMIDLFLFRTLVGALRWNSRLILIGDPYQLPPVGPGFPFRDIIDSGRFPVARLTKIHRQKERSQIITVANAIREAQVPEITNRGEAFFFEIKEPGQLAAVIVELATLRVPRRFGIPFRDIQVISPMRKGPVGVDNLNRLLQAATQKQSAPSLGGFMEGDRVMQIENDYLRGVFNGDIGTVRQVDLPIQSLAVEFNGIEGTVGYDALTLGALSLAYATTVHRYQGGQARAIVLPVHMAHAVMLRNDLLYTAVSRARELLVMVGARKALVYAVKRKENRQQRLTGLLKKLL